MDKAYKKAMEYYSSLCEERLYLTSESCVNVAVEKYIGTLVINFLKEFYNKSFESKQYPVFDTGDFYDVYDTRRNCPIFGTGDFYTREGVDGCGGILFDLLKEVYKEPYWKTDYFLGDLAHIYDNYDIVEDEDGNKKAVFNEATEHGYDDDEYGVECFKLRSNREILKDVYIIDGFFEEEDIDNHLMDSFWNTFRGLFNECSEAYSAKYLLIKAMHVPLFMALDATAFSKEDRVLYLFLLSVVNSLTSITSSGWQLSITEPGLKAAYFVYDLSQEHYDMSNDYLGICELPPDMYLAPYLLDNGIKYLDSKYHFLGGDGHDC